MKKYFWSLLMACIMAMTGFAQQEITIGNGNSVSAYVPIRVHPTFRVIQQSCSAYSLSSKYR